MRVYEELKIWLGRAELQNVSFFPHSIEIQWIWNSFEWKITRKISSKRDVENQKKKPDAKELKAWIKKQPGEMFKNQNFVCH